MKQSIRGQRVPNWHKPLPKHEFSQRYRRLSQAPLAEDLDTEAEGDHGMDCCCRSCYDGEEHYDFAYKPDLIKQEIRNCIWRENSDNLQSLIPATVWEAFGGSKKSWGIDNAAASKGPDPIRRIGTGTPEICHVF